MSPNMVAESGRERREDISDLGVAASSFPKSSVLGGGLFQLWSEAQDWPAFHDDAWELVSQVDVA